jgi:trk system potassium uptake protein TrkH
MRVYPQAEMERSVREMEYLKERYAAIISSVGMMLFLSGLVMLTPLLGLIAYPAEMAYAPGFGLPAGCLVMIGVALWRGFHPHGRITLSVPEGGVIVVTGWVLVILISAWPFMSIQGLCFPLAVFESMSGWTTTGLSVVDVSRAGRLVLLWRSIIQLAGGAGLAIIMISAIVGPTGVGISRAEGRSDQLVPQVRQSARLVLIIYLSYAAAGTLAYWLAGMTPFDALNHAFAAVSTGGFSTHAESIGYWNSMAVEGVSVALMLLGSLSFVTAWYLWRGRLLVVWRNGEIRLMAVLIPLSAAAVVLVTCRALYPQLGKSLRVGIFETVSALTTTGFSTVGYRDWNGFGVLVLIGLMLIGGGTCSTAGGLKQFRIHLLWKLLVCELRRSLLPRTAVLECSAWEADRRVFVSDRQVRQAVVFVFLYLAVYLLGALLLCAWGFSLPDALFEFASAIGTVGLSVGVTGPGMPLPALWAETLAMFLGRLEFMVVIVSLIKLGRDIRRVTANGSNGA